LETESAFARKGEQQKMKREEALPNVESYLHNVERKNERKKEKKPNQNDKQNKTKCDASRNKKKKI